MLPKKQEVVVCQGVYELLFKTASPFMPSDFIFFQDKAMVRIWNFDNIIYDTKIKIQGTPGLFKEGKIAEHVYMEIPPFGVTPHRARRVLPGHRRRLEFERGLELFGDSMAVDEALEMYRLALDRKRIADQEELERSQLVYATFLEEPEEDIHPPPRIRAQEEPVPVVIKPGLKLVIEVRGMAGGQHPAEVVSVSRCEQGGNVVVRLDDGWLIDKSDYLLIAPNLVLFRYETFLKYEMVEFVFGDSGKGSVVDGVMRDANEARKKMREEAKDKFPEFVGLLKKD